MAGRARLAVVGLSAAAAGAATGELVAGLLPDGRSPVVSAGDFVIRNVPGWVERWAIRTFGHNDKAVLVAGVLLTVAALGFAAASLHRRRPLHAAAVVALTAGLGVVAALTRVDSSVVDALPPLLGGAASWAVLVTLRQLDEDAPAGPLSPEAMGRRSLLVGGGVTLVASAVAAAAGRALQSRVDAGASRALVTLPDPAVPLAAVRAGTELGVAGLAPFVTPNRDFYRIDTSLLVPQVEAESWTLRIHGRVNRELVLTYDELLRRPMVEADVTLACVSNEVGGRLVGNARWLGVPIADLLAEVEPDADADQLVGRAVEGFTTGAPLSAMLDGRPALLAVGMNGEPLPVRHGFPARMVVAGLYGYVSATKWLAEIELARFDDYDAYWIQRGWALPAPIKVASRIDTPRRRAQPGTVQVAGVAWAQRRGISAVQVRVDRGPWHDATLAEAGGVDTWRQWLWEWDAEPGRHRLQVRATSADGEVQTGEHAVPYPSGATGWHEVEVNVKA